MVLFVPLVATDTPGCKDVIHHGKNGLLVPPRDAEALSNAINRMLDSEPLRRTMGKASRKRVQAFFSLDKVADAYAAIYDSLLAGKRND